VLALKVQELLAALSPQPGETVTLILDDSKKRKRGKAMQAVCWMKASSLGRLHVVFSRKRGEPKILGLVTDDPKLSARQIIRAYDPRWQIEVFFKDGQQLLRLGHYQNLSYGAAVNHLHLVFLAHALLTHMVITGGRSAQGRQTPARRRSTADRQNELRRMVWDELIEHLRHFSSSTEVIKKLRRLLVAAGKAKQKNQST
jgi:hypothetical protein